MYRYDMTFFKLVAIAVIVRENRFLPNRNIQNRVFVSYLKGILNGQ